jgi:hypothetical protein
MTGLSMWSHEALSLLFIKRLTVMTGYVGGCRLTSPTWPRSRTGSKPHNRPQLS